MSEPPSVYLLPPGSRSAKPKKVLGLTVFPGTSGRNSGIIKCTRDLVQGRYKKTHSTGENRWCRNRASNLNVNITQHIHKKKYFGSAMLYKLSSIYNISAIGFGRFFWSIKSLFLLERGEWREMCVWRKE